MASQQQTLPSYTTLRQTLDAVLTAYSSPSTWNPEQIWATRTDDCLHSIHPKESLPEAFRNAADKEAHIQALEHLGSVIERFELEVQDVVVDVRTRTVVVRLGAEFDLVGMGDEEGPERGLRTEFMWLMEMDGRGEKVKRVEEFLDRSSFLAVVMSRAAKYAESREKVDQEFGTTPK